MIKTRILVTLALSLALCSMATLAQAPADRPHPGPGGPGGPGGFRGGMLPSEIMKDLTADQKAQIQAIAKTAHEKQQELDKQALTQKEYRAQSMQIHQDARGQMENVLTSDQKARLTQIEEQHRQHGPGGPDRQRP